MGVSAAAVRLLFPDWPFGGVDIPTVCSEKSMTRQSEAGSCDINAIMRGYEKTGVLPVEAREAVFADVSTLGSFREVLDVIQAATEGFMELPARVRARFDNDPVAFVDFCGRPENRAELVELGLVEAPAPAPVVAAAAGAAARGTT